MAQVNRQELFSGVWLRTVHTDKFKSNYLSVTFLTPLEQQHASSYALLPQVLRQGSAQHPDMQSISAALDELYGGAIEPVVRKKGESQCVGFAASFLDDAYALEGEKILPAAAQLLGELLLEPLVEKGVFSSEYVKTEKENLLDRIRGQINDKRTYATHRLTQIMCQHEAYGVDRLGDEARVQAIMPASLWDSYKNLLANASVEIYYCGSTSAQEVAQILKSVFAPLAQGGERVVPECEVGLHAPAQPTVVHEHMDIAQGKLAMGFRTGGITCWETEYPAMLLCNAIFGGTTLSKLFMNVREKLSLCYYASSVYDKMKGLVIVSSGIEFDKYEVAKAEILRQLETICKGEIEPWELEGARRTLIGGYLSVLDEQSRQEDFWLSQAAAGLDADVAQTVAALETVTAEQVASAARTLELDTIYFLSGKED